MTSQYLPPIFDSYGAPYKPRELFFYLTGEICNRLTFPDRKIDSKILTLLESKYGHNPEFKVYFTKNNFAEPEDVKDSAYLLILRKDIIFTFSFMFAAIYSTAADNDPEIEEIKKMINSCIIKESHKSHYYLIVKNRSFDIDFSLRKCNVKKQKMEISTHYNDDFLPVNERITAFLHQESSGLIIFHGEQGTGKTTYIRHLIHSIDKKLIYLPVDMVDMISNPNFLPFMLNYKDSILVIEDCEDLLQTRMSGKKMNPALVNILNLCDGLLGDTMQLKLICTFNAPLTSIDKALLRKGRLSAMYEFKKLEAKKANLIIENYKMNIPLTDTPITLAELFHYEQYSFNHSEKQIGFKLDS